MANYTIQNPYTTPSTSINTQEDYQKLQQDYANMLGQNPYTNQRVHGPVSFPSPIPGNYKRYKEDENGPYALAIDLLAKVARRPYNGKFSAFIQSGPDYTSATKRMSDMIVVRFPWEGRYRTTSFETADMTGDQVLELAYAIAREDEEKVLDLYALVSVIGFADEPTEAPNIAYGDGST